MNSIVRVFSLIGLIQICLAEIRTFDVSTNELEPLNELPDTIKDDVEKAEVKLYYEAFCPFSRDFVSQALGPAVTKIGDYLELHTYPYGNANTTERDGHYVFHCQHGANECYGNKLHACALDIIPSIKDAVLFNACMMDNHRVRDGSDNIAANYCGDEMKFDPRPIIQCAGSDKGDLLMKLAGDETDKVKDMEGVPWVVLNGKELRGEYMDFWSLVCKSFKNPPKACKE